MNLHRGLLSMKPTLVRPLFEGPLDIVGDVHGEIEALRSLMVNLGYGSDGTHPDDRRLVFVGDLTDRGPDSPAVVDLVQNLVKSGRAQCVLGNHDFNILVDHKKPENKWFWGEDFLAQDESVVPQVLADDSIRQRVRAFFRTLPLALERDDLRIVHASWDDEMIDIAKDTTDVESLYVLHRDLIESKLASQGLEEVDRGLRHQNENPVKLLTSGPEERSEQPYESGGKIRNEQRVKWWNEYTGPFCVFGHYSISYGEARGSESAFCVDFGVGKRWTERREGKSKTFSCKLGALRLPERTVVFDEEGQQTVRTVNHLR